MTNNLYEWAQKCPECGGKPQNTSNSPESTHLKCACGWSAKTINKTIRNRTISAMVKHGQAIK